MSRGQELKGLGFSQARRLTARRREGVVWNRHSLFEHGHSAIHPKRLGETYPWGPFRGQDSV